MALICLLSVLTALPFQRKGKTAFCLLMFVLAAAEAAHVCYM